MSHRVFISYSHDDEEAVRSIVEILKGNGLTVLWDQDFAAGRGFQEQIKSFIAFAHVFVPIITERSSSRGWVHQEIGYALALNVPVLPIAIDTLPAQMIEQLHCIKLDTPEQLQSEISGDVIANLVAEVAEPSQALFHCAVQQEERSTMIARYCKEVLRLGGPRHVRHRGGLSAFAVPTQPVTNSVWRQRFDGLPRSEFQCGLLREERLALDPHAREAGVSLIINIEGTYDKYGPLARRTRLTTLKTFLESLPDDTTRVGLDPDLSHGENTLLIGDWFVATAAAGRQGAGYRQTILSRHAPTMGRRVAEFDEELADLFSRTGIAPQDSRRAAIEAIQKKIGELS